MTQMKYEFHPAANIFPYMPEAELQALVDDIKAHGLREPIERLDGRILDGRNRLRACALAGIDPLFVDVATDDPVAYVLSKNLHRRHLNESQRAMVGAAAMEFYEREAKERQKASGGNHTPQNVPVPDKFTEAHSASHKNESREKAGSLVNVSGVTIQRAKKVRAKGSPALQAAVVSGKIRVNTAAKLADLPQDEQDRIVAAGIVKKQPGPRKARLGNDAPKTMRLSGRALADATICQKALAARDDIATGLHAVDVRAHYGLTTHEYGRAKIVAESGNQDLIDALNSGLLQINTAAQLARETPEAIAAGIEKARLELAAKNHKPLTTHGRPKADVLLELLERTWVDWRGFSQNLPVNSKSVPQSAEKQEEALRLCRDVRLAVNGYLDRIEEEIARCSAKTAAKKSS
jgi:hypothetical protein